MSESRFTTDENQRRDTEIRKTIRFVEDFYLRNKRSMSEEKLALLLSQLEQKLSAEDHSSAQFYSFMLFLKLCSNYRNILPESFCQFQDSKALFQGFSSLKKSQWFSSQTSLVIGFIKVQLAEHAPQLPTEKFKEEYKEEHKEEQLNTSKKIGPMI